MDFENNDETSLYLSELRLILISLAMMKLLFFVRIFEDFGFLVSMIQFCLFDLVPFMATYVLFMIIFSMVYIVLSTEPDGETASI